MSTRPLVSTRERAVAAFTAALDATSAEPALAGVHAAIAAQRDRYLEKMSVALIGRVSSGKSTLANALLGGTYAPTGIGELTFNVSWLRHGPDAGVTVHFGDGRPTEWRARRDLDELAAQARAERADGSLREYLAAIRYLEVTDPNPHLEPFELVDTPGLDAASGNDRARKTLEFIGRTPDEVHADTIAFASRADALVVVFPKTPSARDMELLADFTRYGIGAANPVTTVGVLTKIETEWPRCGDPMREGKQRAAGLLAAPHVRGLMFELLPLAGKMAAAAGVLSAADYDDLTAFKDMPGAALERALAFGPAFGNAPYPELPLPADRRKALFTMLSGYGFFASCELIRSGVGSVDELRAELADRSGLIGLRRLLLEHFAGRADVIKLRRAIDGVAPLPSQVAAGLGPRELDPVERAAAMVTDLDQVPAFRRLGVLRDYWQGLLTFTDDDGEELLEVAGERGPRLTDRLGAPAGTSLAELAAIAASRHARWSRAVHDPAYRGPSRAACTVMLSAYDEISCEISHEINRAACQGES
jgi:dynamin family protein